MSKTTSTNDSRLAFLEGAILIPAPACAAMGAMSESWWHAKVAKGEAPKPALRQPRCTRWRRDEVERFWRELADAGTEPSTIQLMADRAKRASDAARTRESTAVAGA